MPLNDHTGTYTATARILHWLTALFVLLAIPAGIVMGRMGQGPAADFHRSLGAVLIPIVLFRIFWRMTHRPPSLPFDIPRSQRLAAEVVHYALYLCILVQPIVGWIATSAYRAPITVFWLFTLPPVWKEDRAFSEKLFALHMYIGIALVALLAAHIGAALFHHFVRKDRVLMRMIAGA